MYKFTLLDIKSSVLDAYTEERKTETEKENRETAKISLIESAFNAKEIRINSDEV